MSDIKKVAVLGSGVMGGAIAAHCANAGIPVKLMDIVLPDNDNRNVLAEGAVARMLKTKPAPFMNKRAAKLVETGNLEDDLESLADCDLIIEAVIENLAIKKDLYARLEAVKKEGAIITSNTSTIPLNQLVDGRGDEFRQNFAITHFFNPPRYMRLLELVQGADTSDAVMDRLAQFGDVVLGKEIVVCKDTPGFIANRLGITWMMGSSEKAVELGLTVEEADSVLGKPMGMPKTGLFGLSDLVGIDLGPKVNQSMADNLPKSDLFFSYFNENSVLAQRVTQMIADGYTGRKGKGGYYAIDKTGGKKKKLSLDIASGEYRPFQKANLASVKGARKGGLKALVSHEDKGGHFAWESMKALSGYAAMLLGEIADTIVEIDLAMVNGYGMKFGPFELIDQVGVDYFVERLEADGFEVGAILKAAAGRPLYKVEGTSRFYMGLEGEYHEITVDEDAKTLDDYKRGAERFFGNKSGSIWDLGDGIACVEIHSMKDAVDQELIAVFQKATKLEKDGFRGVVIHNTGPNFCIGANIGLAAFSANMAMWPLLENSIAEGQKAMMALKYSNIPVVGAPSGMALGGGCEILLHCNHVQAHAETYMGLVEVGVGVIPGWGGCKESILRQSKISKVGGPMMPLITAFTNISTAKVGTSAAECRDMALLTKKDGVTMNRKRVLADAKKAAIQMAEAGFVPPEKQVIRLPGATAATAFNMSVDDFVQRGMATKYDQVVSKELAHVISGGDTDITVELTEQDLLNLERQAFMKLMRNKGTMDRIVTMLETGKPLRN